MSLLTLSRYANVFILKNHLLFQGKGQRVETTSRVTRGAFLFRYGGTIIKEDDPFGLVSISSGRKSKYEFRCDGELYRYFPLDCLIGMQFNYFLT